MGELFDKQVQFARLLPKLYLFLQEQGYEYTLGDAYRDKRVTYGHPMSLHRFRLAQDVNLFKDGVYLQTAKDHLPFGLFWESLHPDCCWGGRFGESKPGAGDGWDANHYSFKYRGMK